MMTMVDLILAVLKGDVASAEVLRDMLLEQGQVAVASGVVMHVGDNRHGFAYIREGVSVELFGLRERSEWKRDEETGKGGTRKWLEAYSRRFVMGDRAEYDSYNLSYYGPIVGISAKRIQIVKARRLEPGTKQKRASLKLESFNWRNWDFDAGQAFEKNSETMMYI